MDRYKLKNYIRKCVREHFKQVEEATTTGNIAGYNTPMAFSDKSKKSKKKKKKNSENSTGYKTVPIVRR